jgi:hypothetical protein
MDAYYSRPEVSNSDLSWLKEQLSSRPGRPDPTAAYSFGRLIDAMITEPERVNFTLRTLDGVEVSRDDFKRAEAMKRAFFADEVCRGLIAGAQGQAVMSKNREFDYGGYKFTLPCRCKWDLWRGDLGWGGDIKSTSATTQAQFDNAARYFDYDRQRAWYMDIAGSDRDVLLGISKSNFKVFKISIFRDSDFYRNGFQKYNELAAKWHMLFGHNRPPVNESR